MCHGDYRYSVQQETTHELISVVSTHSIREGAEQGVQLEKGLAENLQSDGPSWNWSDSHVREQDGHVTIPSEDTSTDHHWSTSLNLNIHLRPCPQIKQ